MKKSSLLIAAIIAVGLSLRLFNLANLFYFTHDEETIVWRIMPLLRDRNLFLLGGVTPFHVHLGPWFYYLSAVMLLISGLNPLGWGIMAAIVSVFTMAMLFILTRKLYGLVPGLLATSYYATSFLMVAFDRHWWPLSLGPLLSLSVIYGLINSNPIILGAAIAIGFHTDPSNWALILLTGSVLVMRRQLKILSITAIFLAVSFVPLVAFDLKHQGQNISAINQYFSETKSHQGLSRAKFVFTALYIPRTLGRLLYSPQTELTKIYSYCPQYSQRRIESAPLITTIMAIILLGWFFLSTKSSAIIKLYFGLVIVGINVYGNFFSSDLFDHYLTTLFPLFFLILARAMNRLPRRLAIITTILFVAINLNSFRHITNRYGYGDKVSAVSWVSQELNGQPFSLDIVGSCFRYSGIRYLFTLQGNEPDLSFVDPNFFWLYKSVPKTTYPDKHVVLVMFDNQEPPAVKQQYLDLLSRVTSRRQFGNIDVLIVDNSDKTFSINFSQ